MSKLSLISFSQFSWKEKSNLLSKTGSSHVIPTLEGETAADGKELLQDLGMIQSGNSKETQQLPSKTSHFPRCALEWLFLLRREILEGLRGFLCTFRLRDATDPLGGVRMKGWRGLQVSLLFQGACLIPVLEKQEQVGKETLEQRKATRGAETWDGLQEGQRWLGCFSWNRDTGATPKCQNGVGMGILETIQ